MDPLCSAPAQSTWSLLYPKERAVAAPAISILPAHRASDIEPVVRYASVLGSSVDVT